MNRFRKAFEIILKAAAFTITYRQMSAVLLLLAVMLPITVPVPIWAYDLNLPEPPVKESHIPVGMLSGGSFTDLFDSLLSWNDNKKNKKTRKSSLTADDRRNVGKTVTTDASKGSDLTSDGEVSGISETERSSKEVEPPTAVGSGNLKSNGAGRALARSAALLNQLPVDERESLYAPDNNLGAPAAQTEADSANRPATLPIRHRAGSANFSFGLPLASLSGRGIDAGVGLTYNSRTWNKSCTEYSQQSPYDCTQNHFTYDVEESWVAPGFTSGLGYLTSNFVSRTVLMMEGGNAVSHTMTEIVPEGTVEPSGLRRPISCKTQSQIPGGHQSSTYCTAYRTGDGSFIRVDRVGSSYSTTGNVNYDNTNFIVTHSDGTKVYYSNPFGGGNTRRHYPLIIQDSNGNRVRIAYKNGSSGRIDYLIDTLNRQIKFHYENDEFGNPDKLVAVTIPGMGSSETIQTVRFYYEDLTLNTTGKFNGTITAPATVRTLRYIYMPATKTAYKYTYHSNYGMIKKIERLVGVAVNSTSTTATGAVTSDGASAATTEYDFPDGSTALDDAPRYTKRTDDWLGRTGTTAPETLYDFPEPTGGETVSKITVKNASFEPATGGVAYADVVTENVIEGGLIKETSVKKIYGPSGQYNYVMSKVRYFWNSDRLLNKIEVTNDSGLTKATEFDYDQYFNQSEVREYGYSAPGSLGTLLRTTEIAHQTGTNWITANLLNLPTSVETIVGGTPVSKTLIEYDHNGDHSSLLSYSDMDTSTHSRDYNPNYPAWDEVVCPDLKPSQDSFVPPGGCVTIHHPGYTAASAYRGNVTKVTEFSDATLSTDSNADVKNYNYDIAGNLVSATLSCCQLKTIGYGTLFTDTGYAFPMKETKGSSTPQLVSEFTYNTNTGLLLSSKDPNLQITDYEYESDTLRPKKTIYPNGGYVENFYSDKEISNPADLLPGYVRQKTTLEASKFVESYGYYDARGIGMRSATQTPDGWSVSAVESDLLGRPIKTYNPFYATTPNGAVPTGTKFTEATAIDAFGRSTGVKLQDDTTASTYFSVNTDIPTNFTKTFVTMTDQAGKKRRQVFDALGRLVRTDEPDANGSLGAVDASLPFQQTSYEYDGNDNLSKVIQSDGTVTQERKFKYDALSRLVAEKQVEASPTLALDGTHGSPDPNKWTKVLKYNGDGLLEQGIDARGVTTTFDYDTLNRVKEVVYSDGTPKVKYYYDQARTGFFNNGALTKVETIRETSTPAAIFATSAEFDYDKMGRLRKHRQWIDAQQYDLEYEYNLAGQMTSQKYPSGKVVTSSYDANGRLSGVADAQRTYLSGMQYQGKGNSLSQMSLGNGTVENYVLNDRFQMAQQELKKGSEVLQKYDYGYGQINPSTGNLDTTKNNGQLSVVESYIGSNKQATQKFQYDHLGRLKESAEYRGDNNNLTYKQKFDFDRFGNLYRKAASNPTTGQGNPLAFTAIEEGTTTGTGDIEKTTNRFRTDTNYDDAGNVLSDDKFREMDFSYDANGRQIKAARSSAPDAWTVYDAGGNRVATNINNIWQYMVYDAMGKLVAEYGNVADGLGGVKYVQQDWQGSVRTVANANGFVISRTDHQAFGGDVGYGTGQRSIEKGYNAEPATLQGYGMTERDSATGQDHTWFRKNENAAGRWTSPDPYNGSMNLGDPQSFNRYSYVQSQPTNFIDPSGLNMESNEFIFCDPDRWIPETGTLYVGKCYRYVSGGGSTTIGTTWTPIEVGGGGGGGETQTQKNPCDKHAKALADPKVKAALDSAWTNSKYGKYSSTPDSREQGGLLASNKRGSAWRAFDFTRTDNAFRLNGFGAWGEKTVDANKALNFQYYFHTHPYRKFEEIRGEPGSSAYAPRLPSDDDYSVSKNSGLLGIIVTKDEFIVFDQNKILCSFGRT